MSAPVLIAVAVAIPAILFVAIYAFAKSSIWFAARPRVLAVAEMIFGPIYAAAGWWVAEDSASAVPFVVIGVVAFVLGVYNWFRGQVVKLD